MIIHTNINGISTFHEVQKDTQILFGLTRIIADIVNIGRLEIEIIHIVSITN